MFIFPHFSKKYSKNINAAAQLIRINLLLSFSNNLKKIVQCWVAGDDLNKALVQPGMVSFYPPVSWHAMLAGYGVFPELTAQNLLTEKFGHSAIDAAQKYDLAHIDQFIQRCSVNFADHQQFIDENLINK